MSEIIYFFMVLVGCLSAVIGSITGTGGGILNVPFLIFFGYSEYSSGISLFAIIFNGLTASIFNIRKKLVDFKIALIFIPTAIIGGTIGAFIFDVLKSINLDYFKLIFTILLIISAVKIYFKKYKEGEKEELVKVENLNRKLIFLGILGGFSTGILSGLLGIGGGLIAVPYFTLIIGLSMHVAIGTSLFVMIFTSTSGAISHSLQGNLPVFAIILGIFLAIGAVIGANLGPRVAYKLKDSEIRKVFGIIMMFIAIPMIWIRILIPIADPIEIFFMELNNFINSLLP